MIRSTNCFTAIHQTDSFLFLLSNWKTSLFQRHDLIDPALMARFPGKFRSEPDVHDLHRQIFAYDPRAQCHHVGVVVQTGHFCRPGVGQQGAADAVDLIGGDGYADAGGTQHNAPLAFPAGNRPGGRSGKVGVIAAFRGIGAEVPDLMPLLFQMLDDFIFQRKRTVVTADGNFDSSVSFVLKSRTRR